jgi:hypothetical protein
VPDVPRLDVPRLELPSIVLPVVVLPVHGLEEVVLRLGIAIVAPGDKSVVCEVTPGEGTVIIGLTPALSISVEPSDIVPPPSDEPGVVPGVKSGEALPVEETGVENPDVQPLDDIPPPSKAEPAVAVDDGGI